MINTVRSKKSRKYRALLYMVTLLLWAASTKAQYTGLTIEQCYKLAEENYPLTKQRGLIEETKAFTVDNIAKGVYPQFGVSGAATYQSDVTKIVIPGFNIPVASKDQYKLYGEVSQTITGFSINKQNKEISKANAGE